jgi:uncharacterized coiled-coil DUF342 family protein
MTSIALETINSQIAECLSGNGDFETLRSLEAQKKDVLDREHFERVQTIKAEIEDLEAQQVINRERVAELDVDRQLFAAQMNKLSLEIESLQENYSDCNGKIYLANSAIDTNRKAINEKKSELANLIQTKIKEQV